MAAVFKHTLDPCPITLRSKCQCVQQMLLPYCRVLLYRCKYTRLPLDGSETLLFKRVQRGSHLGRMYFPPPFLDNDQVQQPRPVVWHGDMFCFPAAIYLRGWVKTGTLLIGDNATAPLHSVSLCSSTFEMTRKETNGATAAFTSTCSLKPFATTVQLFSSPQPPVAHPTHTYVHSWLTLITC